MTEQQEAAHILAITQGDNLEEAILNALIWRNSKAKAYLLGGKILCLGLFLYSCAIGIMLANPEPLMVPAR